jgi:hypothetical protein
MVCAQRSNPTGWTLADYINKLCTSHMPRGHGLLRKVKFQLKFWGRHWGGPAVSLIVNLQTYHLQKNLLQIGG